MKVKTKVKAGLAPTCGCGARGKGDHKPSYLGRHTR